jgi:hypothetical protein
MIVEREGGDIDDTLALAVLAQTVIWGDESACCFCAMSGV